MSEITIPSSTPEEDPKHVEKMVAKAEAGTTNTPPAKATDAKPEWLGDFESPEALAKAYDELRAKMSAEGAPKEGDDADKPKGEAAEADPAQAAEAAKAVEEAGMDMAALESEFTENGELSAESYEKLEKAGFDKDTVNKYIAGQQAIAEQMQSRIEAHVGGAETLDSMISWAAENLSDAEKEAYNNVMDTADEAGLKLALDGLKAKYVAAQGNEPKLLSGSAKGDTGSVFRSVKELTTAMGDPRYASDPAYRQDVEAKLARSDIF